MSRSMTLTNQIHHQTKMEEVKFSHMRAVQVNANGDEAVEEDQSHQRLGDLDW